MDQTHQQQQQKQQHKHSGGLCSRTELNIRNNRKQQDLKLQQQQQQPEQKQIVDIDNKNNNDDGYDDKQDNNIKDGTFEQQHGKKRYITNVASNKIQLEPLPSTSSFATNVNRYQQPQQQHNEEQQKSTVLLNKYKLIRNARKIYPVRRPPTAVQKQHQPQELQQPQQYITMTGSHLRRNVQLINKPFNAAQSYTNASYTFPQQKQNVYRKINTVSRRIGSVDGKAQYIEKTVNNNNSNNNSINTAKQLPLFSGSSSSPQFLPHNPAPAPPHGSFSIRKVRMVTTDNEIN